MKSEYYLVHLLGASARVSAIVREEVFAIVRTRPWYYNGRLGRIYAIRFGEKPWVTVPQDNGGFELVRIDDNPRKAVTFEEVTAIFLGGTTITYELQFEKGAPGS